MSSIISGGGLGALAIVYGHQRLNDDVIWFCVILIIILVQIIQEVGMFISRKTDKRIK
jgi:D-methionine transport system permease protein